MPWYRSIKKIETKSRSRDKEFPLVTGVVGGVNGLMTLMIDDDAQKTGLHFWDVM